MLKRARGWSCARWKPAYCRCNGALADWTYAIFTVRRSMNTSTAAERHVNDPSTPTQAARAGLLEDLQRSEATAPDWAQAAPTAFLRVHSSENNPEEGGRLRQWIERLGGRLSRHGHPPARPQMALCITDLTGRRFFHCDHSDTITPITLPAGTYHVAAGCGQVKRSYTVTLLPGSTLDLHLRLPWQPPR